MRARDYYINLCRPNKSAILPITMANKLNNSIWLLDTILQNQPISFKGIMHKWEISSQYDGRKMSRSTFNRWKGYAETIFHINIKCQEGGQYGYYIDEDDQINKTNDLRIWLLDHYHITSILNNNIGIKDKILTENIPSARNFLYEITEAIKKEQTTQFTYKKFELPEEETTIVGLPLCIKQYKQRWYVLLQKEDSDIRIYALDRMSNFTILPDIHIQKIISNTDITNYWKNSYGIFTHHDKEPEHIVLKVSHRYSPFLRSLPLHISQQEIATHSTHSLFRYHLCIERDFIQELLSNGTDIEVIEPLPLRDDIANTIKEMLAMYEK